MGEFKIAHNRPLITSQDQAAVQAVLQSGWIAEGPAVHALEKSFCALNGGGAATAVSSGTAALFLALHGLDIGVGHKVAVPTYACSALLNAVKMTGGEPVLVDVRPDDFTIDADALANLQVDAAIAVHTFGASADVAALQAHTPVVIEDCCQSLGGGQGKLGAAAIYSFYATKVITGGQGGLVWDAQGRVAERARDYREFDCRKSYVPRFNYQLTDIQAAMVNSQFARLDTIRERRQTIHARYTEAASTMLVAGWGVQAGVAAAEHLPYRFVLIAPDEPARDALQRAMGEAGVQTIVPVERFELLHNYLELTPEQFPVAERLARTTLSIPLYPGLSDDKIDHVCRALEKTL